MAENNNLTTKDMLILRKAIAREIVSNYEEMRANMGITGMPSEPEVKTFWNYYGTVFQPMLSWALDVLTETTRMGPGWRVD